MRFKKILPFSLVLLSLFGTWAFQKGEVRVEHQMPDRIAPGMRKEVRIRIHKGDRGGFAKLELDVPNGFKVKAIEQSGASFTFKDGTAKFIWMAMPKGGQFLVKYTIKAKKGIKEGDHTIQGRFRYLEDNKRRKVKLEDQVIKVEKGKGTDEKSGDDAGKKSKEEKKGSPDSTGTKEAPKVRAERKVTRAKGRGFEVRTHLKKGKLQGFGKLVDSVPEGFEAEGMKENGASFTYEAGKAKFVWTSMPGKGSFKVSYQLRPTSAEAGEHRITGYFSYLVKGNTKNHRLDTSRFILEEDEEVQDQDSGSTEKDSASSSGRELADEGSEGKGDEKGQDQQGQQDEDDQGENKKEEDEEEKKVTDVPAPQKGVDFRVQICAGHDEVAEDHFERVYGYDGDYDIDQHDGWLKYLTGKFEEYKKARDKRVYFRNNFELPGPFVTAYNDGERITVQEALMVTDQEWVQ